MPHDPRNFEYLKLSNLTQSSLNLSALRVTDGVEATIPRNTILAGNESAYLVRDQAAFRARFGESFRIIGEFRGVIGQQG